MEQTKTLVSDLIRFWFDVETSSDSGPVREFWFRSTPDIDADMARRFQAAHVSAATGNLDDAMTTADGSLALVLLLDQIPRNIFRNSARAFATDAKARTVAARAIESGLDRTMSANARLFLYLPFEHSEDLRDQERSVELFAALGNADTLKYAQDHHEVIRRFGRFPHRNAVLGRNSSADELAYLKDAATWGQG